MTLIDESILDKLSIHIRYPHAWNQPLITATVAIDDEDNRNAIERFLTLRSFDDVQLIASSIANQHSMSLDMQSMAYPHRKAPENSGITVGDSLEFEATLSPTAFNQMMLTVFTKLIDTIASPTDDFASNEDWQAFLDSVETLQKRVNE